MDGRAHTATELAIEGDVTPATGSFHLKRLLESGLVSLAKQGRHRYFRLASPEIAKTVESVMGLSTSSHNQAGRRGPADRELRMARTCYDHLAGEYAVAFYDSLLAHGMIEVKTASVSLTPAGERLFERVGVDTGRAMQQRRLSCGSCLDWTERRFHLSGAVGAALLVKLRERGWVSALPGSRRVEVSRSGQEFLTQLRFKSGS